MYLKGETSYFSSLNHGTMINSYKNPQYLADENLAESSSKASASAAPDQGHLLVGSLEARQGGTSGQRLDDWMIWGYPHDFGNPWSMDWFRGNFTGKPHI